MKAKRKMYIVQDIAALAQELSGREASLYSLIKADMEDLEALKEMLEYARESHKNKRAEPAHHAAVGD
jgi:hypothetical protein